MSYYKKIKGLNLELRNVIKISNKCKIKFNKCYKFVFYRKNNSILIKFSEFTTNTYHIKKMSKINNNFNF
jgi:hypothetical protein